MSAVTTLPIRHTYTAADLARLPDDGNRYELIDGTLVVTPAPLTSHQVAVGELFLALRLACPDHLRVLMAPLDVRLADDTVVQPDLLVARRDAFGDHGLATSPLLAVEVLSPSTKLIDLNLKKSRYELAGCPSYWIVDPGLDGVAPTITAWQLTDGAYSVARHCVEGTHLHFDQPFPVDIDPRRLAG